MALRTDPFRTAIFDDIVFFQPQKCTIVQQFTNRSPSQNTPTHTHQNFFAGNFFRRLRLCPFLTPPQAPALQEGRGRVESGPGGCWLGQQPPGQPGLKNLWFRSFRQIRGQASCWRAGGGLVGGPTRARDVAHAGPLRRDGVRHVRARFFFVA